MFCYRYLDFKSAKWSLEDGWFKTTKPSDFNDPFDCRLNIVGSPSDKVLREYINREFKSICARARSVNPDLNRVNMGRQMLFDRLRSEMDKQDYARQMTDAMYGAYDMVQRIICFSTAACDDECGDNLMWSHYADKCRGIRIGFEIDDTNHLTMYHLERVRYYREMPSIDLAKCSRWPMGGDDSELRDYFIKCVFSKDISWEYEKEVRLVIPLNYPVDPPVFQQRQIEGKVLDMVRFPYDVIRTVDFGVRANVEEAKKLKQTLQSNELAKHIRFRKAELRSDVYGYRYEEL